MTAPLSPLVKAANRIDRNVLRKFGEHAPHQPMSALLRTIQEHAKPGDPIYDAGLRMAMSINNALGFTSGDDL